LILVSEKEKLSFLRTLLPLFQSWI